MRTIKVKGLGRAFGKPDIIEIIFSIISEDKDYEIALQKASDWYNKLKSALVEIGFNEDDLKTIHFSINSYYDTINEYNYGKQVFAGYRHIHNLKLEFPLDINRLGQVLNIISLTNTDPNISINFTIKDKSKLKQQVIKDAVINAKIIASILAEANSVVLGDVVDIIYEWNDLRTHSQTKYDMLTYMSKGQELNFDITPEDIELSETVMVIWEIK